MNNKSVLWFIVGFILFLAGIWVIDNSVIVGIVLFLAGISLMILLSVSVMNRSGSIKANYFHKGGSASQKIELHTATETPADIWDRVTENKGETK